jgi:hypothetical protein
MNKQAHYFSSHVSKALLTQTTIYQVLIFKTYPTNALILSQLPIKCLFTGAVFCLKTYLLMH